MIRDANSSFCRTLVDEWLRHGVTRAVVAPGSRSTPLALALADRMDTAVFHDERSAAFHALGHGLATGTPSIVLCTSGTAAAHFHAAALEASASLVPMIICTADRPPELHDTGANQTMTQTHLYGNAVRWYFDPGPPDLAASGSWRSIASQAVAESCGSRPGPVHLNLPFREPLYPGGEHGTAIDGRPDGSPWTRFPEGISIADATTVDRLAALVEHYPRGVVVAGQHPGLDWDTARAFSEASGWPILADPVSDLRRQGSITTYDALVRTRWAARHVPDAVLRVGRPPTSKALNGWFDGAHLITVGDHAAWLDESRGAADIVRGNAATTLRMITDRLTQGPDLTWLEPWANAEETARGALDAFCDGLDEHFEGATARAVVAALPDAGWLLVGSSMPVRDVDSFARPRSTGHIRSNRGINGIDGMISTASGMAAATGAPTVALVGDIGFLHDSNGLIGLASRGIDLTIVVVDNDGGGIFSFLPPRGDDRFEELFGTPHGVDLDALASAHHLPVVNPEPAEVETVTRDAIAGGGVRVVKITTVRERNVVLHEMANAAVAAAID